MARGIAFQPVRMPPRIWEGQVWSATSTEIVLRDGWRVGMYLGSFTYDAWGNVYGRLRGYQQLNERGIEFAITDFDVDAHTVQRYVDAYNVEAAARLILSGNDTLIGSAGADVLFGYTGDDVMEGQAGSDVLYGGDGDDVLRGGADNDQLYGEAGDDRLFGESGNDFLFGGAGADWLDGGTGADRMEGGAGDDTYVVDDLADLVVERAGEGLDTVRTMIRFTLPDHMENLVLIGTAAIDGSGNRLANRITGNASANTLRGFAGDDHLSGGAGHDRLFGDEGNDVLLGGTGNDWLDGGTGADRMKGGPGNDTYVVDTAGDRVIERAGEGRDTVRASVSFTLPDHVEELILLGAAPLSGSGNAKANVIIGNAGANHLRGLGGNDRLSGGEGDDWLEGGPGADTLSGGPGRDLFIYRAVADSRAGSASRDVIDDFTPGEDRIDLSAIDANWAVTGKQGFAFIGAAAFTARGQVRAVSLGSDTLIEANVAGDFAADFAILLRGTHTLGAADFLLG